MGRRGLLHEVGDVREPLERVPDDGRPRPAGDATVALAATDAEAIGSDLAALGTAVETDGDTLVVTGAKRWITNATGCDYFLTLDRLPRYVRVELARLLPRLSKEDSVSAAEREDSWGRERLFTAILELFLEIAKSVPTVLLIEDVQWADAGTLDLLTYLRATAAGSALSLLVTCRSDDAPVDRPVVEWLAHSRAAMAREVRLQPLTREEVAEQAAALVGAPTSSEFLDELYRRAEGNPFLTEQLVAAADAPSGAGRLMLPQQLPGGLVELLITRVREVSKDARATLGALAVAGRPLTEQMLSGITGLAPSQVRVALRELLAASLLAPITHDGTCRTRHALLAEAVPADLLPGELISSHASVAEALNNADDPALFSEIAAHWAAACRPLDELRATVAAARTAAQVFAFAEAATLWQRAITLCEKVPDTATALGLDLARLHVEAYDALDAAGQRGAAGALAEDAYARFADWPDPQVAALIHLNAAQYRQLDNVSMARPLLEKALRLFDGAPPSADQAEALASYANLCDSEGRFQIAASHLERGLHVAEAAGASASVVRLLALLAHLRFLEGQVAQGFAALQRGHTIAQTLDDADPALRIAIWETDALLKVGRLEEAWQVALDGVEQARRGGRGNSIAAAMIRSNGVEAMLELGATDTAASLAEPATEGSPRLDDWILHVGRADIELRRGLIGEAARRLTSVRHLPLGGNPEFEREIAQRAAHVSLWHRNPEEALDAIERSLARCEGTQQELSCGQLLVLGLRAAADLAESSRARRDDAGERRGRAAVDRLNAALERMGGRPFVNHAFLPRIPADYASWSAESSRAGGTSDAVAWEAVAVLWENLRCFHRAAYAWWRSAEAHLLGG